MKKLPKRISDKYRAHVDDVARLLAEEARCYSRAARRCQTELGLAKVTERTLRRWLNVAEFRAAVEAYEDASADRKRTRPALRGPARIAWLTDVEENLRTGYDEAEADKERDRCLGHLLRVGAEIRQEETHYESLRQAQVRRSFARFLRNLVKWISRRHEKLFAVMEPVIRDALSNVQQIMKGEPE